MKTMSPTKLREVVKEIEVELTKLTRLEQEIQQVVEILKQSEEHSTIYYESLALKLHNFYTGCERICRLITAELNGSLPSSYDWHRRLLEGMSIKREDRPAVLSEETTLALREYLGFRHVVRNLYGYELNSKRVAQLVADYPAVWHQFEHELKEFLHWLRLLAEQLDQ